MTIKRYWKILKDAHLEVLWRAAVWATRCQSLHGVSWTQLLLPSETLQQGKLLAPVCVPLLIGSRKQAGTWITWIHKQLCSKNQERKNPDLVHCRACHTRGNEDRKGSQGNEGNVAMSKIFDSDQFLPIPAVIASMSLMEWSIAVAKKHWLLGFPEKIFVMKTSCGQSPNTLAAVASTEDRIKQRCQNKRCHTVWQRYSEMSKQRCLSETFFDHFWSSLCWVTVGPLLWLQLSNISWSEFWKTLGSLKLHQSPHGIGRGLSRISIGSHESLKTATLGIPHFWISKILKQWFILIHTLYYSILTLTLYISIFVLSWVSLNLFESLWISLNLRCAQLVRLTWPCKFWSGAASMHLSVKGVEMLSVAKAQSILEISCHGRVIGKSHWRNQTVRHEQWTWIWKI